YLIRPRQQCRWNGQPERLRGLEVDDQLELRGLLDWEVRRLGALQDSTGKRPKASVSVGEAGPVGHETATCRMFSEQRDRRETLCNCSGSKLGSVPGQRCGKFGRIVNHEKVRRNALSARCGRGQFAITSPGHRGRCPRDVVRSQPTLERFGTSILR